MLRRRPSSLPLVIAIGDNFIAYCDNSTRYLNLSQACSIILLMPLPTPTNDHEKFQRLLRVIRAERKVARADIARSMNISQQTAARYESGERRMDLVELRQWCLAVGVPVGEVVRRFLEAVTKDG